jgi:hypothetical protein
VLWNQDKFCGKEFDTNGGMGHATALVGYNDDDPNPKNHYWIILNSEGTADGLRPNGIFRVPMQMNYDCGIKMGSTPDYAVHFEIMGAKQGKSLALAFKGSGQGRVTSDPPGIDCATSDGTCSANFEDGESVVLTATANAKNSVFAGWSGGECSGTGACEITLDDDIELNNTFDSICTYGIFPASRKMPAKGGSTTVVVRSDEGEDCPSPQVSTATTWIETNDPVFLNDRGTVKAVVDANENPTARSGTVTIGGQTFTINQAGIVCQLAALKPSAGRFAVGGGNGQFAVTTQGTCDWAAAAEDKAKEWITVDTGATGKGPGTVGYTVKANDTGGVRTGKITVTIAGSPNKKRVFTVVQLRK